jgi:hypothetical protein
MTIYPQSPRDCILWILTNRDGKMDREEIEEMHRDEIYHLGPYPSEDEKAIARTFPERC